MFPVSNKDVPAGSSSQHDTTELEGVVDSRKGVKPSLAERNRERQQRFRQRQKSKIEELEARCQRLTAQALALSSEKDDLAKNVSLLKNLVHVRDLQLVAVTSQLAQQLSGNVEIKTELQSLDDVGSIDSALHQQPTLALEAVQSARREAQGKVSQLQAQHLITQSAEGPSSTDSESHEAIHGVLRGSSPASAPQLPPSRPESPSPALDQLCRVAELAELQRAEPSPTMPLHPDPEPSTSMQLSEIAQTFDLSARHSTGFQRTADVVLTVEGQRVMVHSAMLSAHSEFFAHTFRQLQHSQPLFLTGDDPLEVDTGIPGKRLKVVLLFLAHCYGALDLAPVADSDVMRLTMLADEYGARSLLDACDAAIVSRSEGRPFSYFVDLSQGGDIVDWIRLSDRLGLRRVSGVCETHLARHLKENRLWRENTRLNELGQECLLRVINKLAEL